MSMTAGAMDDGPAAAVPPAISTTGEPASSPGVSATRGGGGGGPVATAVDMSKAAATATGGGGSGGGCGRVYAALVLSGLFFLAEIVASHVTHSLVLLIYAYQMLYNVLALVLLVISHHICQERTLKNTFGWARVEVLGTLVNMLFLMALCFAISVAAVQTIVHASHENTEPHYPMLLLFFGILGLAVDIVCYIVIGGTRVRRGCNLRIVQGAEVQVNFVVGTESGTEEEDDQAPLPCQMQLPDEPSAKQLQSLLPTHAHHALSDAKSWRSCLLEAMRTCGGCLLVVGCACAVHFGKGALPRYVDPVLAVVAVAILICTSYPRIKESGLILLQNVPHNVDVTTMQKRIMQEFPSILNVHEFHLWQLTNTHLIATVHIVFGSPAVYASIADRLNRYLHEQGITSTTVQPEFCQETHTGGSQCILQCSQAKHCGSLTCCGSHAAKEAELRRRNAAAVHPTPNGDGLLALPASAAVSASRASSVTSLDSQVLCELGGLKETDL
ncbi:proton-coupled zinc antiporter SLC30A1-like isoform X1 [Dermacentor albipictus]|uniref:proton-coupled zinc antiporter SLC30A1-like isoform X1 n=2 Tax=Dermacentor albipictus TaxID=60249 RepID=UPI0038FCB381